MVDKEHNKNCMIYDELDEEKQQFWFNCNQRKFLRNTDTFYYSVKFKNDFTPKTKDKAVLSFRSMVQDYRDRLMKSFDEIIPFQIAGLNNVYVVHLFFKAGFYNFCLHMPDEFDIFFAPVTPPGSDGKSVTPECVVQIRSQLLWTFGFIDSFERSFEYVTALASKFCFQIDKVTENRVDFCWHTNYFLNPTKFITDENMYRLQVTTLGGKNQESYQHNFKSGSEGFETDTFTIGKKGDRIFLRFYNKTKEVIEKNYKPWFFKVWFFNGLISRYDLYCYELAYQEKKYKYLYIARLKWYLEHGTNEKFKEKCKYIITQYDKFGLVGDNLMNFANLITPRLNTIINVEFETHRRFLKTMVRQPFRDNTGQGVKKDIYDFFDNINVFCDYITFYSYRLVQGEDENKSRRPLHPFWESLRKTKLIDTKKIEKNRLPKKFRHYERNMNAEVIKKRFVHTAVTLGIYAKGRLNMDSTGLDMMDALCCLNDNDIHDAEVYKSKQKKRLSRFLDDPIDGIMYDRQLSIIDDNGEVFDSKNIVDFFKGNREDDKDDTQECL